MVRETLCDIFQIPDQDLGLLGVGMAALGGTLLSETELRALSRSSLSRASLQSGGLRTPGHPAGLLRTPGGHFQTQGELMAGRGAPPPPALLSCPVEEECPPTYREDYVYPYSQDEVITVKRWASMASLAPDTPGASPCAAPPQRSPSPGLSRTGASPLSPLHLSPQATPTSPT